MKVAYLFFGSITVDLILTVVLFFVVPDPQHRLAWTVAYPGLGLLMLFWYLYAGLDSRKRWPNKPFIVRLGKILFFER